MAVVAGVQHVKDGKLVDTTASANSLSKSKKASGDTMGKEAFMQLLVAQMKYQDPLEPTSNTEYISQLATFSSLESMQNLNGTVKDDFASNLIGKEVILRVTSPETGNIDYIDGRVDLIVREGGKTYVSVEDGLYNIDDLDTVIDKTYKDALVKTEEFGQILSKLPDKAEKLELSQKGQLEKAKEFYSNLTEYEKEFFDKWFGGYVKKYDALVERMNQLEKTAESGKGKNDADKGKDDNSIPEEETKD